MVEASETPKGIGDNNGRSHAAKTSVVEASETPKGIGDESFIRCITVIVSSKRVRRRKALVTQRFFTGQYFLAPVEASETPKGIGDVMGNFSLTWATKVEASETPKGIGDHCLRVSFISRAEVEASETPKGIGDCNADTTRGSTPLCRSE